MTINSPNPVVGDVQALIADCQAEIAEIEKALTTWGEEWIPYLQSKLKRQQVALAAMTAERCGSLIQAVNPKTGSVNIFYRSRGIESIDPEEVAEWEMQEVEHLYTTPPAQLFRPVQLPKPVQQTEASDYGLESRDGYGLHWGSVETLKLVAESLRQQGYEVKS